VLETSGVPIFENDGNFSGYRGIDRDITERKRAEKDRKNLEARLQRMEKMEALGTLAGGVAHDLNNILSGLVGYPDLILMQLPEGSPLREPVLGIKRSGQKAAATVQDLLTLASRGMVSTEAMDLNRVISDYMKTPEQEKTQSLYPDVRFEVFLELDLLPIKGSPVHLSKTVMNLLSNATEAIPGRGVVTISTRNQYLDRPIKGYDHVMEGDYVVLEVSDTGKGISPGDMGRIFEPFYTKKTMGRSGTGLGLAVVWGTVRDHNGYIDVWSEEGRGTTFTLYFPVTREVLTLDQPPVSLSEYTGKGETILVVDDVMEQRELAVAMLSKLNYKVTSVSSGEAAIEYMKKGQTDLLILDMIMDPGMDGLETYQRVLKINPRQKAIIVSGFSETDRVKMAQELGAGAYVRKPYILEKIGLAIRRELDK
jgi:signal transduction histidine kinase